MRTTHHKVNKHINPKFHYSGELVEEGVIVVEHLSTEDMVADLLTKALSVTQHEYLASLLLNK